MTEDQERAFLISKITQGVERLLLSESVSEEEKNEIAKEMLALIESEKEQVNDKT